METNNSETIQTSTLCLDFSVFHLLAWEKAYLYITTSHAGLEGACLMPC